MLSLETRQRLRPALAYFNQHAPRIYRGITRGSAEAADLDATWTTLMDNPHSPDAAHWFLHATHAYTKTHPMIPRSPADRLTQETLPPSSDPLFDSAQWAAFHVRFNTPSHPFQSPPKEIPDVSTQSHT